MPGAGTTATSRGVPGGTSASDNSLNDRPARAQRFASGRLSVFGDELGPVSPELILVSPPELAEQARSLLPPLPYVPELDGRLAGTAPIGEVSRPSAVADAALRGRGIPQTVGMLVIVTVAAVALGFITGRASSGFFGTAEQSGSVSPAEVPDPETGGTRTTRLKRTASPRPQSPREGGPNRIAPSRVLAWAASERANAYVVRVFRGGKKIFEVGTKHARLKLPTALPLRSGRYRWMVLSVTGGRGNVRYGRPLVDSKFVIPTAEPKASSR